MKKQGLKDYYADYLIANQYGVAISFLRACIGGKFVPKYSYHLHFFLSYDRKPDSLFILCLDTGAFITVDNYSKILGNGIKEDKLIDEKVIELSEQFIDQVWQNVNAGGTKEEVLFLERDPKLWNAFNEIKQGSFVNSMNNIKRYENEGVVESTTETKKYQKEKIAYEIGVEDKSRDGIETEAI